MSHFRGKRILITGGSQGIGFSAARLAVQQGAKVCMAARSAERLEAAKAQIQNAVPGADGRVHVVAMDVRDDESVARGVASAVEALGGLDILINNAGYAHPGYFEQMSMSVFDDMLQVNYLGMVRVVRAVAPILVRQRGGHIVNVSSMLGFMGVFGYTAYSGSKYATVGFTECLRQEMLPHGVKVSICYPPTTKTPGLEQENGIKPPESWAIEGSSKAYEADEVAESLLAGIAKGRFEIVPGLGSRAIWWAQRFVPGVVRAATDQILTRFQKTKTPSTAG